MKEVDSKILEESLKALSLAFDEFVTECSDNNIPKCPSNQALAKARGCLPPYCINAYKKKK